MANAEIPEGVETYNDLFENVEPNFPSLDNVADEFVEKMDYILKEKLFVLILQTQEV